jgi:hypothetical protein
MANTGLLLSHAFSENDEMHQEIAKAIVHDRLEVNNGMIFENIVAQMFTARDKKLYFYSRADNQDRSNTMEIDFLIIDNSKPTKISPIEVKTGKDYTTDSLNKFSLKFKDKSGKKYLIHTKDLFQKDDIVYIPVYMTMFYRIMRMEFNQNFCAINGS